MPLDSLILTFIAITVTFIGIFITGGRILKTQIKNELRKEFKEELKNAR